MYHQKNKPISNLTPLVKPCTYTCVVTQHTHTLPKLHKLPGQSKVWMARHKEGRHGLDQRHTQLKSMVQTIEKAQGIVEACSFTENHELLVYAVLWQETSLDGCYKQLGYIHECSKECMVGTPLLQLLVRLVHT